MMKKIFHRTLIAVSVFAIVCAVALYQDAQSLPSGKISIVNAQKTFKDLNPRVTYAPGAAKNTSIYVPGLTRNDQIYSVWYIDTTKFKARYWDHSDSVYYQAADSIRDGFATDTGFVMVLWHKIK